jgi:phenylacetate-CoA ligase
MVTDRKSGYYDEQREMMDKTARMEFERDTLRIAMEYAYGKSSAMRKKLEDAGVDPKSVRERKDLEGIPLTKKAELRKIQEQDLPFGGLTGCDVHELKRIYVSPGPTYDPEGRSESHYRWEKAFYAAGFRRGDVVQNTFSYHMSPAGFMFDESLINLGCTVIPAGVGNTEMQAQVMKELPVTGYVGTPSFLMTILTKAREMGIEPLGDFNLEVALVAGEMLPDSLRKQFSDEFGIMVRQCYGTADVGSLGYECYFAKGMHIPDEIILEIVEPESGKQVQDGETGEVVVTLGSPVYPLVRFATGDLSYIDDDPCPCGRTSKKLARIVGRVDMVTKVRGMFVYPTQVEKLEQRFAEVSRMQVIVEREGHEDRMNICAVLAKGANPSDDLRTKIELEGREVFKLRGICSFVADGEIVEGGKKIVDRRKWD